MAKVLHSKFTDVKIPENISLTDYLLQSAKQFGNKLALVFIQNLYALHKTLQYVDCH